MAFNDDPLGLGLRQRATSAKQAYEAQNRELAKQSGQLVSFSNLGPLGDPQWDAFRQALAERGVTKVAGGEGLPMARFGMPAGQVSPGLDLAEQASMPEAAKSRRLGTAAEFQNPSPAKAALRSVQRATTPKQSPRSRY